MSHRVLNLLPNAVSQEPDRVLHGIVSTNQPAPKSFTDPLYVVVPDWSPDHYYVINDWPALHGATLPPAGNEVMLSTDSRGNMRCVWWSGTRTAEPLARVVPSVQKGLVVDLDWGITDAEKTQEMAEVVASRARWAQIGPGWSALEPTTKGVFDYAGAIAMEDDVIARLTAAGVRIIAELDQAPGWANGGKDTRTPPLHVQDYADYVTFAVNRWKTKIKHWHLWNEPNLAQFWKPAPDPASYVALLKAGYAAAKAADPTCTVLIGAIALNDAAWLKSLYGVAPDLGLYFDAINTHPYTVHGQAPEVTYSDARPVWSFETDAVGGAPAGFTGNSQGGAPRPKLCAVASADASTRSVHVVTGAMTSSSMDVALVSSSTQAVVAGSTYTLAATVNVIEGGGSLAVYAQIDWYHGVTFLDSSGSWGERVGKEGVFEVAAAGVAPPTADNAYILIGGSGAGTLDFYVDNVNWNTGAHLWTFETDTVGGPPADFTITSQGGAPPAAVGEVSVDWADPGWANSGTRSVHLVTGEMRSSTQNTRLLSSPSLTVTGGRTYTLEAAVNVVEGGQGLRVYAQVDWYKGLTYVTSIADATDHWGAMGEIPVSVTGVAPPDVDTAFVMIGAGGAGVVDMYVDDITWRDHSAPISRDCFTGYKELASVVTSHGAAKPVWVTEFGWSTCTPPDSFLGGVSDDKQADFIRRAYALMRADRLRGEVYPEVALVYILRQSYTGPLEDPADWTTNLSLVHFDFSEKPAYTVFLEELPGDVLA